MKLTFLGVSSALSDGFNSNILLDVKDETLLIDCGGDIKHSLKAANRKPEEIDAVYISHTHGDHSYGLEWLGYYNYFVLNKRIIPLYVHGKILNDLWCILSPSMNKLQGGRDFATLRRYFDVCSDLSAFVFNGISFKMIENLHVFNWVENMYSYSLFTEACKDKSFYISCDTRDCHVVEEISSKYYFHDCDVMNLGGAHVNYNTLKLLPENIKKKMWLYHYIDLDKYDGKYGEMPDAEKDGFAGFVKEGQIFEL
jgi:hypothetical protein